MLHDKVSYFVNSKQNILNKNFADGLKKSGFKSWVDGDSRWLAPHLSDFYPHETVISHIRRLLAGKFARASCLNETPTQFARRMSKVEHLRLCVACETVADGLWRSDL